MRRHFAARWPQARRSLATMTTPTISAATACLDSVIVLVGPYPIRLVNWFMSK
jgi:hypothetical protein